MAQTRTVRGRRAGFRIRPLHIVVAVVAVPLAVVSALFSLADTVRNRAPGMIPGFWPDPVARMNIVARGLIADPARAGGEETRDVALAVLRAQPLNADALHLLIVWDSVKGHEVAANRLADVSQRVSRRNIPTQLYQVERMVRRGDVKGALTHYDIALRVSTDSGKLLFPILIGAMADPVIRTGLVPYVRQQAPWIRGLFFNALDVQGGAASVAALLLDPRVDTRTDMVDRLAPDLLTRLVSLREQKLAEGVFRRLRGADAGMLANPAFTDQTTDPRFGLLGWRPVDAPDANVTFERLGSSGRRVFVSAAGAMGEQTVLQRVLALPPGRYRFVERRGPEDGDGKTSWRISCPVRSGGATSLWASRGETGAANPGDFVVPATCPWQQIELAVTPDADGSAVNLFVDRIILKPVSADARIGAG